MLQSPKSNAISSVESEAALLGALIQTEAGRAEVVQAVRAEMLADERHQTIYRALYDLFAKGSAFGALEVIVELRRRGELVKAGGVEYLGVLMETCPDLAGAVKFAQDVQEFHTRRKVAAALGDLQREVAAPAEGKLDAAGIVGRLVAALAEREGQRGLVPVSEIVWEAMEPQKRSDYAVVTKLSRLDSAINLFEPGEVTILAGRPGSGKSTFMRQLVSVAAEQGAVVVFSLEVTPKVLTQQFVCELARVPFDDWRRERVDDDAMSRITLAAGEVAQKPILIHPSSSVSALNVSIAVAHAQATQPRVASVVIDYLGLMKHEKAERNDLSLASTTRALKQLALERRVPILLLAQLNREVEKRGTSSEHDRPRLADLRDSGAIEQDADNVVFLWRRERDEEYKRVEPRVLTIAKNRNGQIFEMDLMFDKPAGRFHEVRPDGSFGERVVKEEVLR